MLAEQRPTLRAIDPRTLLEQTDYRELEFRSSFRSYVRQRARLLAFLKALPRKSWSRTAVVTGGGPARATCEVTTLLSPQRADQPVSKTALHPRARRAFGC